MFHRIRNMMSRLIPECLAMRPVWVTLDSGLKVCIDSKLSLECFAELFVTQPYAPALNILPKYEVIVDLGANRGFFLLFGIHFLIKQKSALPKFYCIEAAKPNFSRLKRHIVENSLTGLVNPVFGAVCGKRAGFVNLYYSPLAHGMGTVVNKKKLTTKKVSVIDLKKLVTSTKIDLLKIDIEGSEEEFMKEYPDILAKTQVLVGEFHLKEIDYAECQLSLNKSGLYFFNRTYEFEDKLCVDIYVRNKEKV